MSGGAVMSLVTIDELTDVQLDVLREIGNIGQGNAATSLSAFSGGCVNIAVPDVSVLGVSEVMEFMGGPDEVVAGIMVRMTGAVCGMMLTILRRDFVTKMVDTVFGHRVEDFGELNDIERSFVEEIGNILSGSYLNAICELSGLSADVSVPDVTVDMVGAILSVPAIESAVNGSKVLFIDGGFKFSDKYEHYAGQKASCHMIFIPELSSLNRIFSVLGVEK